MLNTKPFSRVKKLLLISSLTLSCFYTQAQDTGCGTDHAMDNLFKMNKRAKQELQQLRKQVHKHLHQRNTAAKSFTIPVVFHVFGKTYNGGSTVTQAIIEEALRKTNEDFQGLNPDYTTIDAPFDKIKQPLNISFKLAKIDPNGNPTTGIVYHNEASGMGNYSSAEVKRVAWDNYKYCNVYITRDLYGDGDFYNSGVAWYPNKAMSDQNLARVVYNGSYLGSNTNENFRSVLTHEFGHYLDLPHTFNGGVCTNDPNAGDGVADTPSHKKHSGGTQCRVIKNCLNQEINNENFMDYTDCYKMFTQGQVARMINALENSPTRNTLWTASNLAATGLTGDLGPRITASSSSLTERYLNDGVIEQTLTLNCHDCTFTKGSGTLNNGTDFTVSNVPQGLNASITLNSTTSATFQLTGTAAAHKASDSKAIAIAFKNSSITGGTSQLYKDRIDNISLEFKDPYTEYCNVNIRYKTYTHITDVTFNNNSNPTGYNGISDYTNAVKHKVKRQQSYPISITTNKGAGGANDNLRIQVWLDANANFIFEDNELVISHSYKNSQTDAQGNYTYNGTISIPANTPLKATAFRVLAHYVQRNEGDTACSTVDSGESEDYGLQVIDKNTPFEVDFFGHPTTVNFSEPVNFSDFSNAANNDELQSWSWSFEGATPAVSTAKNPKGILFPEAGSYDVSLIVTTKNGQRKTVTKKDYITSRLQYCATNPKYGTYFSVNKVQLNTIDHQPGLSNYYNYYNTVSTELTTGSSYNLTLKAEKGNGGDSDINRVRVWADWNFDGQFSSDELIVSKEVKSSDYNSAKEYQFTQAITVPENASVGKRIGLRITGHFVDGNGGETACGSYDSGNTADYGLLIKKGITTPAPTVVSIANATETEGNTLTHLVRLSAKTTTTTTVPFTINNQTALQGQDFEAPTFNKGVSLSQNTLSIPAGVSEFSIFVAAIDDRDVENTETYTIQSGSSTATGTIKDNDTSVPSTYCTAQNTRNDSYITKVTIGTAVQASEGSAYTSYANKSIALNADESFAFAIKTTYDHWSYNAMGAWVDWNNDGTFSDDEKIYHAYKAGPYQAQIDIPSTAVKNQNLRLRVRYSYGSESKITPCGTDGYFGEVEDYSIKLNETSTVDYCEASTTRNDSYITNVRFGAVNNTSTHTPYNDYSHLSATFSKNSAFTVQVQLSNGHWSYNNVAIWIDWNNNGNFELGEEVYRAYQAGPYSASITPPTTAVSDKKLRMRIRYAYGSNEAASACGEDSYFGEVEDYSIQLREDTDATGIDLQVYPNPTTEFLTLKSTVNSAIVLRISTLQNRVVKTKTVQPTAGKTSISVAELPNGIYLLTGTQNGQTFTKKIVISK